MSVSTGPEPGSDRPLVVSEGRNTKRDLLLGAGAFAVFIVLSLGLLTAFSPSMQWALLGKWASARGEAPIQLALVHTNDTWGYMLPCG